MRRLAALARMPRTQPDSAVRPQRQLTLVWRAAGNNPLPEASLPEGYRLERLRPGRDEDAWVAGLQANGELGDWDRSRLARDVTSVLATPHGAVHVRWRGKVVATASACCGDVDERCCGYVGYVNVHPNHRCRGLGRAVVTEAMRELVAEGFTDVYLKTDDHRRAARHLYVALGFEPVVDPADSETSVTAVTSTE